MAGLIGRTVILDGYQCPPGWPMVLDLPRGGATGHNPAATWGLRWGKPCRCFETPPNPPNLPNLKQAHKGEGLPSPFPLLDASSRRVVCSLGILRAPLTPSKKLVKPMVFQHFRFLAPPSPHIEASNSPSKVFRVHFSLSGYIFHHAHRNSIEDLSNIDGISIEHPSKIYRMRQNVVEVHPNDLRWRG